MELKIYRSGMVCALNMCMCVCMLAMMLLQPVHTVHAFFYVFNRVFASRCIRNAHTHTHIHTLTERHRSPIRRGITCHGECLSEGELESVLGGVCRDLPLAAQQRTAQHSRQQQQQHKPGQAQKVGQPKTHTHAHPDTHTAQMDAAPVSHCGCV